MSVYLHDIPLPEAKAQLQAALEQAGLWGVLGSESVPLNEYAIGRVLFEPVWARLSSPHYHASAMDGFAVHSSYTAGAMATNPINLTCSTLAPLKQAEYVDTGDPLPSWAEAVIPIENVELLNEVKDEIADTDPRRTKMIRIRASVTPWSHVRPMGEDIVATQLVLPAGHLLRPVDLGAIAASGHQSIQVARQPRVAVLPTGSELIEIGQPPRPGDIIEFNSLILAAQINSWGGKATRISITPDSFEMIRDRVLGCIPDHDLILLNAGSSAGSEDFSASVVESLGQLLVHGVAVRPGHPVIIGMVGSDERKVPIIGVPGYPVSASLTGEIFVEPLISRWLGRQATAPRIIQATLTRKVTSPPGDDDFMRVALGRVGGQILAAPLSRGAGVITSLVRADGLALLQRGVQGLPAGAPVQVKLYCSEAEIERTIFAIGSHDILLDLLAQFLAQRQRRLTSANVGSLGGLTALRRAEAHLAGSHLLDPETGEYNLSYIEQYLPGMQVVLITLAGREQGLIVPRSNPKQVHELEDLKRPEITFINRQRGSGTRVLLDYELSKISVAPESIQGYNQEEYTHLAVAAAVASGRADCGLGIAAAAIALELEFIPLFQERYDLVIPRKNLDNELLNPLLEILDAADFRKEAASLPGYDLSQMGKRIAEFG